MTKNSRNTVKPIQKLRELTKKFPESQLQAEVTKDVLPKLPTEAEKMKYPDAPIETSPNDPFAPFTSESATGGMPTGTEEPKTPVETPKSDSSSSAGAPKDDKEKTTPIHSEAFVRQMNDCLAKEEYQILKVESSKTKDQDAQTEEEKKAEAEAKLKAAARLPIRSNLTQVTIQIRIQDQADAPC